MLSPVTIRTAPAVRINHYLAAGLLFVSGLCALIFQTVWLKEFRLVFGGSTPASAAVLAIFMGGLGLGNAVLGPRVDKLKNPLLLYALLEAGVTLAAAVSPYLTDLVRLVYTGMGGQESLTVFGATVVRLLFAAFVLGVPTFLMGGTMPAMARAVTGSDDESRGDIGLIYGLNTLGAVCGAALSTFVLLEMFGGRATLWLACGINLMLASVAYLAARIPSGSPAEHAPEPASTKEPGKGRKRPSGANQAEEAAARLLEARNEPPAESSPPEPVAAGPAIPERVYFVAAGLIGFSFFLMELVWFRMLGPILGGSTFTFGAILAVALAGIGAGGVLYPLLYRHRKPTFADFALTCMLEALAIAIPFALGDRIALLTLVLGDLSLFGFEGQILAWIVVASIVVFPAALVSGVQFPVLIALIGQGDRDVGRQLGTAFAWNTLGAMTGSLAGGFGLLPLLSAPGCWIAVTLLLLALGVGALVLEYLRSRRLGSAVGPLVAGGLALAALSGQGPTAVWRHSGIGAGRANLKLGDINEARDYQHTLRRNLAWEEEGRECSVGVVRGNAYSFIVNGKSDGNAVGDAPTQIMLGSLGTILHPNPQTGLVIGLGTGESAGWMAAASSISQVDVVELEPAIRRVAEICAPLNNNALTNPKVRVIYNDARELLLTTSQKYDLIVSEPSNPYRAGVASLFTKEFYDSARARLNQGGVFLQWMQAYEIDARTVRTILSTLQQSFGHVEIWETKTSDVVLVCSAQAIPYNTAQIRRKLQDPGVRQAVLLGWQCDDVEGVAAHFVADERLAAKVRQEFGDLANTDDLNTLEYGFARTVGRREGIESEPLVRQSIKAGFRALPGLAPTDAFDVGRMARGGLLFGVLHGEAIDAGTSLGSADEAAKKYLSLWARFQQGDYAGAAQLWKTLGRQPDILIEKALVAEMLARAGDSAALPLVEALRPIDPGFADGVAGMLLVRSGQREAGAAALRKSAERFRREFHPFSIRLDLLADAVLADISLERSAAPLYRGLFDEPFVLRTHDQRRKEARVALAQCLNDQELVSAFAEFEPHPMWRQNFLRERRDVYRRTQHPLSPRAEADYEDFERAQISSQVLGPAQ